ncbi:MAG: hypothetical protein IAE94_00780 [Chthoniobacterales bacterium]|nr:hypothetical protein [Chthoniobacterales bacterium]
MSFRYAIFGIVFLSAELLTAAEPLTKDQMQSAVRSDAVTIPTPGEFFAAMDEQGQPNWPQLFAPKSVGTTDSREQMALMLGVLVADGYIAVQAQDGQGVKNIGKDIINLAKKLNVSQSVLSRGNSINDFAQNNDWSALREELEATQNEVKLSMVDQKDKDLVVLVTVGAWIRGTQAAAGYISKNYSPGLAGLLRQPAIIEYLLAELGRLPERMQKDGMLANVQQKLGEILRLVNTKDRTPPPPDAVNAVASTMDALVEDIVRENKES